MINQSKWEICIKKREKVKSAFLLLLGHHRASAASSRQLLPIPATNRTTLPFPSLTPFLAPFACASNYFRWIWIFSRCCFCLRQKGNVLRRLSRLKWHAHTPTHTERHAHACTRSLTHSDNYTNDRKSAHNAHESIKSGRERKCDVCMQWEAQRNGKIIKYTHSLTHTYTCEGIHTHTHTHIHNWMPIKPMLEPCWRQKGRKDAPPGQGQHRLCPRAAINKRRAAK